MGIIKAIKLTYDYIKLYEEGNPDGVKRAVDHVDIDIEAGEFVAVLGHNGSGKSTLLRSLNRLNECFDGYDGSGSVKLLINGKMTEIYGDSAPEPSAVRRRAGMVFQVPNPLPLSLRKTSRCRSS